jgi:multicomponent Na+:H+ antiporter subunit D
MNTTLSKFLPFFVATPLAGAFFTALLGRRYKSLPGLVATLVPSGLFGLALLFLWATVTRGPQSHFVGGWAPPFGVPLVCDGLTAFMMVTVYFVSSWVALYSIPYVSHYTSPWKFHALFLLILTGMGGVLMSGDLFDMFVYLEISSLSACTLVAFGTERREIEAAFKYGVINTLGGLFIIFGIAFLYGYASTLNMADMARVLAENGTGNKVVPLASVFLLVGFGMKAAIVPFHAWLPDAHPSAPAPISAMLSGLIIKCLGLYALFRVLFCVLGMTPVLRSVLLFLGALSMGVGAFLAIGQTDFKRLLAFSSLSQVGYIVFGVGLGTPLGIFGGLFHLFNHSIGKSLLFLASGAVDYATGTRDLDQLGGLSKRMPMTGRASLCGAMSIAGIPPFGGFWSKLLIILAAVQAGHLGYAAWAVLSGILTLAYLTKAIKRVFLGPLPDRWKAVDEVPAPMQIAMAALALVCLAGGALLLPGIKGLFLSPARQVFLSGIEYAKIFGGILG